MPVFTPTEAIRLTYGGNIANGADIWSTGLHLVPSAGGDASAAYDALDMVALYNAFADNMIGGASIGLALGNSFEYVRAQLVDASGSPIGVAKYFGPFGGIPGGSTVGFIPQHSVVLTYGTDLRVGRAAKGRSYLPSGYAMPEATGHIDATGILAVRDMALPWLQDIQAAATAADPDLVLATFSPASSVFGSERPAVANEVTTLIIGDVVDTQRRRRNQIKEGYYSYAV